ncbi:MAG: Sigma-54 dependent response regulator [Polyangiaceae bacterium]|jgi:DNA-binding NtrC family response regulator|nr:Sigma-54 dependent response regulator [Polyangiaceae bacterium]
MLGRVEAPTGAMQEFRSGPSQPSRKRQPGLVLLYADTFRELPAAFLLQDPRHVIGRDATAADLVLKAPAVSRVHAEVVRDGRRLVVRDLGSRNGVLVNGRKVQSAALEPLDEVRIGDAIFKFVEEHAEELSRYRIDGALPHGEARRAQNPSALAGGYQIDAIVAEIERVAATPLSVIVRGPSGTGKEVIASELHRLSGRRGKLAAINCTALPQNLIESELFGYKRGAFSGADRDKPGLIRHADGGTLLLDEIGDMPPEAQAKLLRVLQAREVLPLGANVPEPVDVRVVAATHRDLEKLQREGKFREDLFARLNEYSVELPALHERKEDVYLLTQTFLARHGGSGKTPSFAFMSGLLHYDFPYNVRELEACIKRALALSDGATLEPEVLPEAVQDAMSDYGREAGARQSQPPEEEDAQAAPDEPALRELLTKYEGNVAAVGRELGKARMQIHRWMKRYAIDIAEYRPAD